VGKERLKQRNSEIKQERLKESQNFVKGNPAIGKPNDDSF
jgi:hypothetical protein